MMDISTRLVILVVGSYDSPEKMEKVAEEIKYAYPEINHIVSCYGGDFEQGPASELTPDDVHEALDRALPHLLLAQAFFPLLKEDKKSSFTFITGMLGERCSMPNMAALSISNAAAYGIIRSVEAEHADEPQRINEIRIAALIRRDNAAGHPFLKEGHAYPASLIGNEVVNVANGKQNREIIRVMSDYLAKKEAEAKEDEDSSSEEDSE
jgi:NAD(P)-dependent dehydrogenase (short-subunit alcohol dehydrogenase family)